MRQPAKETNDLSQAASLMGQRSWKARLKKYGLKKLKAQLGKAGKAAKRSGRPRLPDDQVKPGALYQRARRERLRKQAMEQKGRRIHGKRN